ncbi:MAG: UvrD-helicase domain-containing protein [Armatimonadetes bacterium]|nr:UvrD-helicase domain-containing protein [Armatimonadota bacterium]
MKTVGRQGHADLVVLNPPQQAAVSHPSGPLLILAGAGSGKTRVLACRAAHLIHERGVRPGAILAVTFTNKAANEMRERIDRLVGARGVGERGSTSHLAAESNEPRVARAMWIGTFHAACSRILRQHGQRAGIDGRFVIYDEDDQRALVRQVLRDLNLDEKRHPPGAVLAAIGAAKNEGVDHVVYAQRAGTAYERVIAHVYHAYQRALLDRRALDFDDLLLTTLHLFQNCPDVLGEYQRRFRHVLVDEYQDTNRVQYLLVKLLAEQHRNLLCVGDDDQSIYKFRGADVRNILEFERDFPDATVIKLEQNYRSTQVILEAAREVIRHNPHRHLKELWTANARGDLITRYEAYDGHDEARFAVEEIRRLNEGSVPYGAMVILYRVNAQSRQFEEYLLRVGIPYQVVGGLRFYERKEIKDILAYLRLVANPHDAISLARVINVPRRGIGDVTVARIQEAAAARGIAPLEAMADPGLQEELPAASRRAAAEFAALIKRLRHAAANLPAADLIERAIVDSGYQTALQAEGGPEAESRLENLRELITVAQEFEAATGERDLDAFLQHLALVTDVDTLEERPDRVVLMTLHSAKGLEFQVVFLTGLEEGLFPHMRALEEPTGLEEERRLCYVGMTRARERLYLTHGQQRAIFGISRPAIPSRFLDEVPAGLVERPTAQRTALSDWTLTRAEAPVDVEDVAVGAAVRHGKFGVGKVLEVEGSGSRAVVTVRFADGVKRLALAYARLETIGAPQGE